jgi:hypothetical protein
VFQSASLDGIHETAAELNYLRGQEYSFFSTGENTQGNPNQPLLIPVHEACLDIAKHVIRVRETSPALEHSPGKVTSMRRLWEVLESRHLETVEGVRTRKPRRLKAPQNYHMPSSLGGVDWSHVAGDDVLNVCIASSEWILWNNKLTSHQPYEASPFNIPDLSSHVLSCLQTYPQDCTSNATPAQRSLAGKLRSLPTELFDHIIDLMDPIENLPVQCTRLIEPVYWQRLLCGKFLPYLWDLDISVVHYCLSDEKWDYELLVRQLAQEGIWEYFKKNDPGKYHHGLWNRRRIWRLMEEMEVGDVKPEVRKLATPEERWVTMQSILRGVPRTRRAALSVSIPPFGPSIHILSTT